MSTEVRLEGEVQGPREQLEAFGRTDQGGTPADRHRAGAQPAADRRPARVNVQSVLEPFADRIRAADLTIVVSHLTSRASSASTTMPRNSSGGPTPCRWACRSTPPSVSTSEIDIFGAGSNPEDPEEMRWGRARRGSPSRSDPITLPDADPVGVEGGDRTRLPGQRLPFDQEGRGEEYRATWMRPILRSREEEPDRPHLVHRDQRGEPRSAKFPTLTTNDRTRVLELRGTWGDFVDLAAGHHPVRPGAGPGDRRVRGQRAERGVAPRLRGGRHLHLSARSGLAACSRWTATGKLFGSVDWQYAFDPPAAGAAVLGRRPRMTAAASHRAASPAITGSRRRPSCAGATWSRIAPGSTATSSTASGGLRPHLGPAGVRCRGSRETRAKSPRSARRRPAEPDREHRLQPGDRTTRSPATAPTRAVDGDETQFLFSLTARF